MKQDVPRPKPEILVTLDGGSIAVWRSVAFLKSPAFVVLTKSAHLALARIEIARAKGHHHITHRQFQSYGIPRDSISHAISELEGLGVIIVQRHAAKSNSFGMSGKWREITSIEQARRIRNIVRNFGIFARRKRERKTAAIIREAREKHQMGR
jgi:hypothetical protein